MKSKQKTYILKKKTTKSPKKKNLININTFNYMVVQQLVDGMIKSGQIGD